MLQSPIWTRPVAIIAALFGALTIYSAGMVLFGGPAPKAAVGDAVPLVLWFDFFRWLCLYSLRLGTLLFRALGEANCMADWDKYTFGVRNVSRYGPARYAV